MENEVSIFENKEFGKVRTVVINEEPWFVGKDVAECLGYSDTFGALKKHVDGDDKLNCQNDSFESNRGMMVINESGVYALIFGSKLPKAKEFKHWVTLEVLPCIRKNGAYMTKSKLHEILDDPTAVVKLCQQIVDFQKELTEQKEENEGLKVQLNKSKEWYSVKLVGIINHVDPKEISWRPLKRESLARGYEIKKTYDQNYLNVNAYHRDIWKAVYPQYKL